MPRYDNRIFIGTRGKKSYHVRLISHQRHMHGPMKSIENVMIVCTTCACMFLHLHAERSADLLINCPGVECTRRPCHWTSYKLSGSTIMLLITRSMCHKQQTRGYFTRYDFATKEKHITKSALSSAPQLVVITSVRGVTPTAPSRGPTTLQSTMQSPWYWSALDNLCTPFLR